MNYTIQQLAKLTGSTVRTLHFYDEIGLLKPAFIGENGYRYYQEIQLATLQQILFYRALGFNLKQVQEIFAHPQFDHTATLKDQKKLLLKKIAQLKQQIKKVESTLKIVEQLKTMTPKEIIQNQQETMDKYINLKFGEEGTIQRKETEAKVNTTVANWRWAEDWMPYLAKGREIWAEFNELYKAGIKPTAPEAQTVAKKQFDYAGKINKQTKEQFLQSAALLRDAKYKEISGLNDAIQHELACYMASAMEHFANKNL